MFEVPAVNEIEKRISQLSEQFNQMSAYEHLKKMMSKYARESLLNFVYKTLCKVKKHSRVDSEPPCHFPILKKKVEEEIKKLKKIRKEAL